MSCVHERSGRLPHEHRIQLDAQLGAIPQRLFEVVPDKSSCSVIPSCTAEASHRAYRSWRSARSCFGIAS